jgi:tellurite resistance protein TerA
MDLKQKGNSAQIGGFKQLKAELRWTAEVDLDLMAFYVTKDGRRGGVYSPNFSGGSLGSLNAFPFIELSGDAGVGAVGGDNVEELKIAKIDELEELYICAINFTDATAGEHNTFSNYDARVVISTDSGETHEVTLASNESGSAVILAKFISNFMGLSVENSSDVMPFARFQSSVPGATELRLESKIVLKQKGDSIEIKGKGEGEIVINLNWHQGETKKGFFGGLVGGSGEIDLDLGCFFEMRDGTRGVIDGLQFSDNPSLQGSLHSVPYIYHLGDDRSGGSSAGEFIKVNLAKISELRRMTIYTFIYEGVAKWNDTDAVIRVQVPGKPEIIVEMGKSNESASFCSIAELRFTGQSISLTKLVTFHPGGHEDCDNTYGWGMDWKAGSK